MSWSIRGYGTKPGAARNIKACKIYGTPAPEEQAAFDRAQAMLLELTAGLPDPSTPESVVIVKADAAGHGANITNLSVSSEWVSQ